MANLKIVQVKQMFNYSTIVLHFLYFRKIELKKVIIEH